MSLEQWALLIALTTSVLCALCGCLLMVKKQAMVSEGLSHAVLPGLVIAFLILRDYSSPWLILGAGLSGLVMIWLSSLIEKTRLVDPDAALGLVFSAMFSFGIVIVSLNLRNTHFHADCIIDGNLALAPLDRLKWGGRDWGPTSFYVVLLMLTLVSGFIALCYKELKLMLFDESMAWQFELRPKLLHLAWLCLVSFTIVVAFEVAGSILIVALMIAPPTAAYLHADRLSHLLAGSVLVALVSTLGGFYWAKSLDIAPTGPIASCAGLVFLLMLCFAPKRGLLSYWWKRQQMRQTVLQSLVLTHIANQTLGELMELSRKSLESSVIRPQQLNQLLAQLAQQGLAINQQDQWELTAQGQQTLTQNQQRLGLEA